MFQRTIALEALRDAKLYPAPLGTPLASFFAWLKAHPDACWPEIVDVVRRDYAEYGERLALAVWRSGDPVIQTSLVVELDRTNEAALLKKLVSSARADRDIAPLRAAIATDDRQLLALIAEKKDLALELRRAVDARLVLPARV